MNKKIMKDLGFDKELALVEQRKCPFCHQPIRSRDFRDHLSLREHGVSGLCQKCQDQMFGK